MPFMFGPALRKPHTPVETGRNVVPQPYWIAFVLAIALVIAFEWEEVYQGFVPATPLGRMVFVLIPAVYAAIAVYLFVVSPLAFAAAIRSSATAACYEHGGFAESRVEVVYAGRHNRSGAVTSGPDTDEIHLVCNDRTRMLGRSRGGVIVGIDPAERDPWP
jgi:hypothetical protein